MWKWINSDSSNARNFLAWRLQKEAIWSLYVGAEMIFDANNNLYTSN